MSHRWCAYLLRCRDGSLYAGATNDLDRRLAAHQAGRGARYTRARRPVVLAWHSPSDLEQGQALRLEARLKRLPAATKRRLAAGDAQLALRLRQECAKPSANTSPAR